MVIQDGKEERCGGEQDVEDPEKFDMFKTEMKSYVAHNRLYTSRNKSKQIINKTKTYIPLTPYFSYAYQL